MNTSNKLIADRYATSFFLAIKENNFESNYKSFTNFIKMWNEIPILKNYLTNPAIQTSKKVKLVDKIFRNETHSAENELAKNFIILLINKNRIQYLSYISDCFEEKVKNFLGFTTIKVLSAVELTDDEKELIKEKLTKHNIDKSKIIIENIVKPELIAGLLIYYKNKIIDTTVKSRLSLLLDKISELEYKIISSDN